MNYPDYEQLARGSAPFAIDTSWAQGRSAFGGLTAALVLSHIEGQTGLTDRDLRTVNIHFCGPVTLEKPCTLQCTVLSQGKSVYQVEGQLLQEDQVRVKVIACFSAQRFSTIEISPPRKEFPQDSLAVPFMKGVMPECMQHMDVKYTSKGIPFSGADEPCVSGWIRFVDPPHHINDAVIVALIDGWPPAVLPMLKEFAPASTITWNVEFIQPRGELAREEYIYYECEAVQAELGYAHSEARVYAPSGQLIAFSRQVVGVYEKPA